MKRALVTASTLLGALLLYFAVAFYGAGFRQAERSLSQNLGDHLFMLHSLVLRGLERKIPPTRAEVEKALAKLDPRCHHEVRELAEWRLESLADVAAPILVAKLALEPLDSEGRFRMRAVLRGVASLKVDAAVPRLLEILESEEDSTLRFDLLDTLGEIRDRRALPALLGVFRSPRTYPMEILQKNERSHALQALARLGGEATPVVIEELESARITRDVRDMCSLLGETRDARAAEVLVGLVRHPSEDVRDSAAHALDVFMGPEAIEPVLAALEKESNDFIRARLIGRVLDDADARDKRVVAALLRLVDDPAVSDHAVQALGTMGGSDATEAFLTAITVTDPIQVMKNLELTSGFPDRQDALPLLRLFLRHESPLVRKKALDSLVNHGHSSEPPPPTKRLKVRQDGETLSIQLPGSRFLPPDRVQIRDGYVRRSRTVAGAALRGAKWSRRFPPGGRPDLNAAEQAWLRSRLGHDPVASAEALVTGLKLELGREPLSRSECRLQIRLLVANGARRAWSPADLEQAVGGVAWRAVVNGREADVSFSQKEREAAMAPGRVAHLSPRVYLAAPVSADCPLEVSIVCRAGGTSVASPTVVFAS